jgi:hypothetical protein
MKLRAITAFYDIGREAADGRRTDQYLAWLNATLRLPLPFTVYLDPIQDATSLQLKAEDRLVRIPWSELMPAKWLPRVETICAKREKFVSSGDLIYRLPKYGPTVHAKFDLIARAARDAQEDAMLWLDAGLARFAEFDLGELKFRPEMVAAILGEADLALVANHRLYDYVRGRPYAPLPGRCERIVLGAMLLVRSSAASTVRDVLYGHIQDHWLPEGLWDTEQTALGEMILAGQIRTVIQEEDRSWLALLASLFERPGRSWMGLRWDTPHALYDRSQAEDYVYALRDLAVRAYRRAFVLRSKDRYVAARLPES